MITRDQRLDLYAQQILERWDAWVEQFSPEELQACWRPAGARQVNLMDALKRSLES